MADTNKTFAEINQIRIGRERFMRVMAVAVVTLEGMVKGQEEELSAAAERYSQAQIDRSNEREKEYRAAVADDAHNEKVAYTQAFFHYRGRWKIFGGKDNNKADKHAKQHVAKLKDAGVFGEAVKAFNDRHKFHWTDQFDDEWPDQSKLYAFQGFLDVARGAWSAAKAGVSTSHLVNVIPDSVEHVIFEMQQAGSLEDFVNKNWRT